MVEYVQTQGRKRSLAGNLGLGVFAISFVLIFIAFCTASWLVSGRRTTGTNLDRIGLWSHCFRYVRDPYYRPNQFTMSCRWIYSQYTSGYDKIRGFSIPGFMVVTQLFFIICFLSILISAGLSLLYFFNYAPKDKLVLFNAVILMAGGLFGGLAVTIFAIFGKRNDWIPDYQHNCFGYSFLLACVGSAAMIVASILYFADLNIQRRKNDEAKQSQVEFQSKSETIV